MTVRRILSIGHPTLRARATSYTTSISFCIAPAVRDMSMTIDEAIAVATTGEAAALRRTDVGRLVPGGPAHLTVIDAPSRHHLAYRPGVPLIWRTLGADYLHPSTHHENRMRKACP